MPIHFEDYLEQVKDYLPIAKKGHRSRFLQKTTTATLRDTLLYLVDRKELSTADANTLRYFFQLQQGDDLRNGILNADIDKFRPVKRFMDGTTGTPTQQTLEMIAILLDFKPRPYSRFLELNGAVENFISEEKQDISEKTATFISEILENKEPDFKKEVEAKKPPMGTRKKITMALSIAVVTFSVGYTTKQFILPSKHCMQWKVDHYELTDCESVPLGIVDNPDGIKPYNEIEFNRKKLTVCDTTTFFNSNNKPIVWYSKQHNVIEFFNMDGSHPVTSCELRRITSYMINKYVKPCD